MARGLWIAAAVAVAGVLTATYFMVRPQGGDRFAQCRTGQVAGGAKIGGPFTLVSETGQTLTSEQALDEPALVYFGYTFCPDVCPMDVARNAQAVSILEEKGAQVKPVFISIDPERDTPEVVADFTDYFHPRMLGLTGTAEQVKAASQAYRTYYRKQESDDDFYLVDHSTFTYLVLPEVGFVDFFRREVSPEDMASRVQCFLNS